MLRSMTFRSVVGAIACVVSASAFAFADTASPVDVPAGEVIAALHELAKQSGIEVIYAAGQLKGVRTQGVRGEYTPEAAVAKLLEGTQLKITVHNSGALLISDLAAGSQGLVSQSDES